MYCLPPECRVLAPSPGRTISVTFSLPLEELKKGVERISPVFAGEFFLRAPGNKRRWSGSPMYSTETGKPLVRYLQLPSRVLGM